MRQKLSITILIFSFLSLKAQLPETDLWLFKTVKDKLHNNVLSEPLNITNRPGYDNQPAFDPDGSRIYYASIQADNQADIYFYDLKSKKNQRLTSTPESEYSPTFTPDGKKMACVVVEADSSQKIHFVSPFTGTHESKFNFDSVGYFTFLNSDSIIYYKLTSPHSLHFYCKEPEDDKFLCQSPIRTFKAPDRHSVVYGIKDSVRVRFFRYDFLLRKATLYAECKSGTEDIYWHPVWGLMKSEEKKILYYDDKKKEWITLYDLSAFGIKKITRFAFDPKNKYLVVVNNL